MKCVALIFLLSLSGCAPYIQAQIDLLAQARRGLQQIAENDSERQALVEQLAQLQRQRLDDAFDADVRERSDLDADWVIESRKGYAAGLDALAKTQASAAHAADVRKQNLEAIDAALTRVQALQSIQLKLDPFDGGEK